MENLSVPGFHDKHTAETSLKTKILDICRRIASLYCYQHIETPHVESAQLLTRGGEDIQKEIYLFQDKGERKIGLRFDLTVPLLRYVAEHSPQMPFKRFAYGDVFRGEKPQKGRFREFTQADFDIVGVTSSNAEIEILEIFSKILTELNFDFIILVNDRRLADKLVELLQCRDKLAFFRILDKAKKLEQTAFLDELKKQLDNPMIDRMLMYINDPEKLLFDIEPLLPEPCQNIRKFMSLFSTVLFDPTIVRGLDYYTGCVFEIYLKNKAFGAIASGGRYDNFIRCNGKPVPAIGGSFGVDRLLGVADLPDIGHDFFISHLYENCFEELKEVQQKLFSFGFSCEVFLEQQDLKKQLKYAEAKNFKFILILRKGEISLIDKISKTEKKFATLNELYAYLKLAYKT
ncbi:MAG: histidine--tRNA ligase [Deltaproteobacteria bacterium]|nr:histidine--tRNA ligase [Deltaproteobacteria bacterium]